MNNLKIEVVQPTGHRDFHDYDSFVYQNEVNPKMSDRRVTSVEILFDEGSNNLWNLKSNYNLNKKFSWNVFQNIPSPIDQYKNKIIVDKVLTIDHDYSDQRNKIDYKIIYDYYEYKSGITYDEMMDARMRILLSKISKIMKNDKLKKYNNQTLISTKTYLDGSKKRNRNNYSHLDRNEHEIW